MMHPHNDNTADESNLFVISAPTTAVMDVRAKQ